MIVYMLRHGSADTGLEDPHSGNENPGLNEEGRRQIEGVCRKAAAAGIGPMRILSSPVRRALESAKICSRSDIGTGEISTTDSLLPEANPGAMLNELADITGEGGVLLVAHHPIISRLAESMLGGSLGFHVKNGGLLGIRQGDGNVVKGEVVCYLE